MKLKQKDPDLFALLKTLNDHRWKQGQRHPLEVILLIIIMDIMAGAKGEQAIVWFAKNNKAALIKALEIQRQEVPTRSVIKGVIEHMDFTVLQNQRIIRNIGF